MSPCILDKKLVAHRSREETRRAEQFDAVKVEFPRNRDLAARAYMRG